jgi:hypothetical protein
MHCESQQNMVMEASPDKQLKNETHWNWFHISYLSTKNDDCQSPATSDLQAASYWNLEVKWRTSNDTSVILNTYVYNFKRRVEKFTGVIRWHKVRRNNVLAISSFIIWWKHLFTFCSMGRGSCLERVENEVHSVTSVRWTVCGLIPCQRKRFSLLKNVHTGYGAHPPFYSIRTGSFFHGGK